MIDYSLGLAQTSSINDLQLEFLLFYTAADWLHTSASTFSGFIIYAAKLLTTVQKDVMRIYNNEINIGARIKAQWVTW